MLAENVRYIAYCVATYTCFDTSWGPLFLIAVAYNLLFVSLSDQLKRKKDSCLIKTFYWFTS